MSFDVVTISAPSGLNDAPFSAYLCPTRDAISRPVAASHNISDVLRDAVTAYLFNGPWSGISGVAKMAILADKTNEEALEGVLHAGPVPLSGSTRGLGAPVPRGLACGWRDIGQCGCALLGNSRQQRGADRQQPVVELIARVVQ